MGTEWLKTHSSVIFKIDYLLYFLTSRCSVLVYKLSTQLFDKITEIKLEKTNTSEIMV